MNESIGSITSISISLKSVNGGDRQLIRQVALFDMEQQKRLTFRIDDHSLISYF
jgi:hypothetical protein